MSTAQRKSRPGGGGSIHFFTSGDRAKHYRNFGPHASLTAGERNRRLSREARR